MPQAAVPIAAEAAVASTMTAAEIAAAQAAAAELAAAQAAAAQTVAATNASILNTIAPAAAPAATTAATTAASALPAAATPMAAGPATIGLGGAPAGTVLGSGAGAGISALPAAATPMAAGPATVGLGGAPAGTVLGSGSGIQALADEIGIQSTVPSATPPWATQTMMPSTPGIPPEVPIYEAPTLSFPPGGAPPQMPYDPTAPFASYPGSLPPAQPLYPTPVTPQVGQAASAMNNASGATSRITEAMQNPMTNSPDLGPAQSSMNYPPGPDRLLAQPPATPDLSPLTNATPGGEQMRNATTQYLRDTAGNANLISSLPAPPAAEPNFLQELYKDFKGMSVPNKILTGMAASSAYDTLTKKPYEPKKYKSTFKPGLYTGYQPVQPTPYQPQYAHGGLADLGGYSDYARGGRMLKGPGDGMSDDIPATIANKQPARLANEEFVIPADVVSHLGNGSSEAGAKVLYKMMDRVRQARTGSKKQGKQINPEKYLA